LNKAEALVVLHEIFDACHESVIISSVSLDPETQIARDGNGRYVIRMKCDLDSQSKDCLKPLLEKHKACLKENNGYIVISGC
jgi:hypothetical protein